MNGSLAICGRLAIGLALISSAALASAVDDPQPGSRHAETRYSVSFTDETAAMAGLRAPTRSTGNLALVAPSFAWRSRRWRFSTSLAAFARTAGQTHAQARVKEAYAGLSAGDWDFSAGKRLIRWGAGYAFTATGILDPPRSATDPTDRLGLNQGREMVTADWVRAGSGLTFVWATAVSLGARRPGARDTFALRYNTLAAGFDLSIIAAQERNGAAFAGTNFTRVFGDAVEVHGEVAWREQASALLGGKFTTRSGISFIGEFYAPANTDYYRASGVSASSGRRHYGFLRVSKSRLRELPGWKEWDISAQVVANVDDGSRVTVLDISRRFGNHVSAYIDAQIPAGKPWRSQYGMLPFAALVSPGIRVQL